MNFKNFFLFFLIFILSILFINSNIFAQSAQDVKSEIQEFQEFISEFKDIYPRSTKETVNEHKTELRERYYSLIKLYYQYLNHKNSEVTNPKKSKEIKKEIKEIENILNKQGMSASSKIREDISSGNKDSAKESFNNRLEDIKQELDETQEIFNDLDNYTLGTDIDSYCRKLNRKSEYFLEISSNEIKETAKLLSKKNINFKKDLFDDINSGSLNIYNITKEIRKKNNTFCVSKDFQKSYKDLVKNIEKEETIETIKNYKDILKGYNQKIVTVNNKDLYNKYDLENIENTITSFESAWDKKISKRKVDNHKGKEVKQKYRSLKNLKDNADKNITNMENKLSEFYNNSQDVITNFDAKLNRFETYLETKFGTQNNLQSIKKNDLEKEINGSKNYVNNIKSEDYDSFIKNYSTYLSNFSQIIKLFNKFNSNPYSKLEDTTDFSKRNSLENKKKTVREKIDLYKTYYEIAKDNDSFKDPKKFEDKLKKLSKKENLSIDNKIQKYNDLINEIKKEKNKINQKVDLEIDVFDYSKFNQDNFVENILNTSNRMNQEIGCALEVSKYSSRMQDLKSKMQDYSSQASEMDVVELKSKIKNIKQKRKDFLDYQNNFKDNIKICAKNKIKSFSDKYNNFSNKLKVYLENQDSFNPNSFKIKNNNKLFTISLNKLKNINNDFFSNKSSYELSIYALEFNSFLNKIDQEKQVFNDLFENIKESLDESKEKVNSFQTEYNKLNTNNKEKINDFKDPGFLSKLFTGKKTACDVFKQEKSYLKELKSKTIDINSQVNLKVNKYNLKDYSEMKSLYNNIYQISNNLIENINNTIDKYNKDITPDCDFTESELLDYKASLKNDFAKFQKFSDKYSHFSNFKKLGNYTLDPSILYNNFKNDFIKFKQIYNNRGSIENNLKYKSYIDGNYQAVKESYDKINLDRIKINNFEKYKFGDFDYIREFNSKLKQISDKVNFVNKTYGVDFKYKNEINSCYNQHDDIYNGFLNNSSVSSDNGYDYHPNSHPNIYIKLEELNSLHKNCKKYTTANYSKLNLVSLLELESRLSSLDSSFDTYKDYSEILNKNINSSIKEKYNIYKDFKYYKESSSLEEYINSVDSLITNINNKNSLLLNQIDQKKQNNYNLFKNDLDSFNNNIDKANKLLNIKEQINEYNFINIDYQGFNVNGSRISDYKSIYNKYENKNLEEISNNLNSYRNDLENYNSSLLSNKNILFNMIKSKIQEFKVNTIYNVNDYLQNNLEYLNNLSNYTENNQLEENINSLTDDIDSLKTRIQSYDLTDEDNFLKIVQDVSKIKNKKNSLESKINKLD